MSNQRLLKLFSVIALVVASFALAGPAQAQWGSQCQGRWFESAQTGRLELSDFEAEQRCVWNGYTPNSLQRSGRCDLPEQANTLIVLTHNWLCNSKWCPTGEGRESNIPLLRPGDPVTLCDYGWIHAGTVIWTRAVYGGRPTPQDNFPCPTGFRLCGTIVTSIGYRQGHWGPAEGYSLSLIGYR